MQTSPEISEPSWFGPPPPADLINSTSCVSPPRLLSQGAEARVWLVNVSKTSTDGETNEVKANLSVGSGINVPKIFSLSQFTSISKGTTTICKERFPKKYRHPQLDVSLTKSRTKAEARCLIRCRKAGVSCPDVFGIAHWLSGGKNDGSNDQSTSACLFLEHIDGCTVRHYFEERSNPCSSNAEQSKEPDVKRARCEVENSDDIVSNQAQDRITTKIDTQTLLVAHTLGTLVAKMHAAGIIHGDLTTSNVMLRNPSWTTTNNNNNSPSWIPQLVLIDFGLATSTAPIQQNNSSKNSKNKQQHSSEEKAVDLYVLERAFLSTHPESELLVEEVWKGYHSYFESLDNDIAEKNDGKESDLVGKFTHVSNSVMSRLEQVRQRGRKRECFG